MDAKPPQQQKRADEARTAGRGVVSITAAKLYFIVASYAVFLTLPRLLKTPEAFGLYATTISIVSILNNVLIQGTIQTVSKRVSEDLGRAQQVLRQALKLQLIVGGVCCLSLLALAPLLAEKVLLDPKMGPLLRITAAVVFSYALYAALIGSLNGQHLFQKQAALDMTFTTLRTTGIIGAAAIGLGVAGAVGGYAAASCVLLLASMVVVGIGRGGEPVAWKSWLAFMVPLWCYHLSINLALQTDLIVIKRTLTEIAMETPGLRDEAAQIASRYAGFYRAAQTFAFVPYQLILAVAFVVFPMVSRAIGESDIEAARRYIREAMRFSLLMLLGVAAPVAGASSGVMRLAYPDAYVAGSGALAVLSFGMVCFALFAVGATALSGGGHPGRAAAIGGAAVAVIAVSDLTLLRMTGLQDRSLTAAACGTTFGTALAFAATGIMVHRRFGAFIALPTALRAIAAGAAGICTAYLIPHESRVMALVALVGGGLCYLLVLVLSREVGTRDLELVRRMLPGR